MGVKTIFKTIFFTIIGLTFFACATELYNASVNGALLRQRIDSAAESSLNYFTQESFRQEGEYSTVNLPNFFAHDAAAGATPYVSGVFYDHADNPVQQELEMFDWYPEATSSMGYSDAYAFPIYELSRLRQYESYDYNIADPDTGQPVGFRYVCKKLPRGGNGLSPYNYYMPGDAGQNPAAYASEYDTHLGIVNRYTENINEMLRWQTGMGNCHDYNDLTSWLDALQAGTSGSNNHFLSLTEREGIYAKGTHVPYTQIRSAVESGYSPANVGMPAFSWQLNRMFKWHLCSSLSGVGITEDVAGEYRTEAIDVDENGVPCMRWSGFNIYVSEARITEIDYYAYNLYDDDDLSEFCEKAGYEIADMEELRTTGVAGYNGHDKLYPNTVIDANGNPYCFTLIIELQYDVPVSYRGITPFRSIINWATHEHGCGYQEFVNGTPSSYAGENYTFNQTMMSGTADDDAFMVESALQYVVLP